SSYVAAYRIATLVSTAGLLFLVSGLEALDLSRPAAWRWAYVAAAVLVLIGIVTILLATEPQQSAAAEADHAHKDPARRIATAAIGAYWDFRGRGLAIAAGILAFVVL